MKMSSHHATATTIHRIKTESTIICLPFHPKSHRKLPETLTPDVPLTHILRAKTTDQKKINLHECTCIRRVWCANDRSHITATGCTVHVIAHTLTHTHTQKYTLCHTHAYGMLNGTFIFRTIVPILAPPPTKPTTTANMCHADTASRWFSRLHRQNAIQMNWIIAPIMCSIKYAGICEWNKWSNR